PGGCVHRPPSLANYPQRLIRRECATVRPIRGERVETVDNREDPRADRSLLTAQPVGITASIPVLVMMSNDRHDWEREFDRRQNLRTNPGMLFHRLELGGSELVWLVENVFGNSQLARVV